MTQADREIFVRALMVLAEMFRTRVSDLLVEGYWDVLKHYALDDVQAAMRDAIISERFFPVAAVLIEHIHQRIERRHMDAQARRALPPAPPSDAEHAAVMAEIAKIRELLAKKMSLPRPDASVFGPSTRAPSERDMVEHAERKRRAFERLQRAGANDRVIRLDRARDGGGTAHPNAPAARRQPRRRVTDGGKGS